ncbi:tyrosine-type recombinase/integrase [Salinicoccus halitifaciens]|uniref:Integrase/recombinase XerD n=1 Tax=Salinicoccus halitifaciens TaxID=1073415 RepID=A0ABV2E5R9_9STAP|nr:tyrosine-type recombinase/integrase [Salinicoccus halitifaciens]MCD2137196.1 tyrosine-type recombinase/integrase [Salinicoccus halitifaciens]
MSLKRRKSKKPAAIRFSDMKEIVYSQKLGTTSKETADNYIKALNELIYFFDDGYVKDLTIEDAYDYLDYLLNDKPHFRGDKNRSSKVGLARRSVNTYLTLTKGAYTVLLELGYIKSKHDVFRDINQLKYQKQSPKVIKPSELNKLIKSLDERYYTDLRMLTAIHLFLESFGRVSEVLELTEDDIDFDRNIVTFNKTKNSLFRSVPVSQKTIDLVDRLLDHNESFTKNEGRIFLTNVGNPLKRDSFGAHLEKCLKRAGVKQHITNHMFRHTAATAFMEQKGSLKTLQYYLGHSDISVTEIYLHIDEVKNIRNQAKHSPLNILKENKVKTRRNIRSHRRYVK